MSLSYRLWIMLLVMAAFICFALYNRLGYERELTREERTHIESLQIRLAELTQVKPSAASPGAAPSSSSSRQAEARPHPPQMRPRSD